MAAAKAKKKAPAKKGKATEPPKKVKMVDAEFTVRVRVPDWCKPGKMASAVKHALTDAVDSVAEGEWFDTSKYKVTVKPVPPPPSPDATNKPLPPNEAAHGQPQVVHNTIPTTPLAQVTSVSGV